MQNDSQAPPPPATSPQNPYASTQVTSPPYRAGDVSGSPSTHSGLAKASFWVSLASFLMALASVIAIIVMVTQLFQNLNYSQNIDPAELTNSITSKTGFLIVMGLLYLLSGVTAIAGLVMGIISLKSHHTRKSLPTAAVVLSSIVILFFLFGILASLS